VIAAGALVDRVTFLRPVLTSDGIGGQTEGTPTTLGTFFALVEALEGSEALQAQQVMASLSHRIRVRFQDLRVSDRARYSRAGVSHQLEVKQVIPVDRDELHLLCAEEMA
jgi:head-tail adaptor